MRVICVDDSPGYATGQPCPLIKWKEYTIVRECESRFHPNGKGVILAEIEIAETDITCSCFNRKRFRPIKEVDVNAMFRCEETVNA